MVGWACTPHPHQAGLFFPSWWNVSQKVAIATLCVLCGLDDTNYRDGTAVVNYTEYTMRKFSVLKFYSITQRKREFSKVSKYIALTFPLWMYLNSKVTPPKNNDKRKKQHLSLGRSVQEICIFQGRCPLLQKEKAGTKTTKVIRISDFSPSWDQYPIQQR